MKNKLLIVLGVFLFSQITYAQNSNTTVFKSVSRSAANAVAEYKPTPEPPKTKITGRVIYEDTGKPVRRGSVVLLYIPDKNRENSKEPFEGFNENPQTDVITDDDGVFAMEDVTAGEYYPKINVAGVLKPDTFDTFYKNNSNLNIKNLDEYFEKIIVVEGVKEQQVLIRAKRGGAISGRIMYSDGDPAVNIQVEALRDGKYGFENGSASIGKTKTDDRGFYRFSSLLSGEYIIRIIEPTIREVRYSTSRDISELKTYYGDSANVKEAKIINLSLAEEKSEINITIPSRKTYTISGLVVSKSTKAPIKNARIKFSKSDESSILSYTAIENYKNISTDENGRWKIIDLPKGTYKFEVSPPRLNNENQEADNSKSKPKKEFRYSETRKEIIIENNDLENVLFEMPIAAKIFGSIEYEDKKEMTDESVLFMDEEKEQYAFTYFTSADYNELRKVKQRQWKFEILDVGEGSFLLSSVRNGSDDGFYVKSATANGQDLLNSSFAIKENSEIKDVKIILAGDVGTIKGKIEAKDENLLKFTAVFLVPVNKPNAESLYRYSEVNENGEFQVKVAPMEYFVVVQSRSIFREFYKMKQSEWYEKFTKDAEKVTVKPNETTTITIKR